MQGSKTKYIFVVGGVVSGLGKGVVTSSIGLLLKSCGYKVNMIKIDPYLNIDAGTMRPAEHGETFVTFDGGEIDQDLGNYERFLNQDFGRENNITSGKVFKTIIEKERAFGYEGRDVEMIPDVPNEVKRRFYELEKGYDFVVVEIGGTTGDIENLPFLYAAREVGRERKSMYIVAAYVPFLRNVGELKTKPAQHAITQLRSTGINPDMLITRSEISLDAPRRETLSKRCFLDPQMIIDDPDMDSIYDLPIELEKQEIVKKVLGHFGLKNSADLSGWKKFVLGIKKPNREIKVALVGKYVSHGSSQHKDVYVSVLEAIRHAGAKLKTKIQVVPIDANDLDAKELANGKYDAVVVPQGWGSRGVEGKIAAVKWARENKVPYLGLCFGMQMAVIEYARHVCNLKNANSSEADANTPYPVVYVMEDQKKYLEAHQYGGTIRLGSWPCVIQNNTILHSIYKTSNVLERHRHRYEVNNEYKELLAKKGLIFSGLSPDGHLVEAIELPKSVHPFFVGTQFHPEYQSRPLNPHPIFVSFIEAAIKSKKVEKCPLVARA